MWTVLVVSVVLAASARPSATSPIAHAPASAGLPDVGVPLAAMSDSELQWVRDYLVDLIREDPWQDNKMPLLYVEPPPPQQQQQERAAQPGPGPNNEDADEDNEAVAVSKRSRYYRRYPWKRVTRNRGTYDPDLYMCNPSREDVIQLLVGLHRAREGDTGRTINFCNRKRPASSVFTNIRFIG